MVEQQKPRIRPRPDLGLRALLPLWRRALSRASLLDDALAGVAAVGPSFALALLIAQHEALAALACAVIGSAVILYSLPHVFGLATSGPSSPSRASRGRRRSSSQGRLSRSSSRTS